MSRPATAPPRVRPVALVGVVALLAAVGLRAHDDAKISERGDPVSGPGSRGVVRLPTEGEILGFAARNTALLAWLTAEQVSGAPQHASDVWGYAAPSGREYAILGLESGTAFVDVTDPVEPVPLRVVTGAASTWRDMAVYDRYAYSVNEGGNGLQVVDLRRIDRGKVRLVAEYQGEGLRTAHNVSVNPASGFAYLSGPNLGHGGLLPVDLSDPRAPRALPEAITPDYVHDALVVTYRKGRYAGREIAFAFAAEKGLQIFDVTDKESVRLLSELRYPGLAYCHSGWLHGKGRFLYVNDELDERKGNTARTATHIVRVDDLENPRFVRTFRNRQTSVDHNSMVRGSYLFQADYTSGFRIFEVKRARRPREVGYFDTHPDTDAPLYRGAWGVYAGLPSGIVLVSDIERGLFILL